MGIVTHKDHEILTIYPFNVLALAMALYGSLAVSCTGSQRPSEPVKPWRKEVSTPTLTPNTQPAPQRVPANPTIDTAASPLPSGSAPQAAATLQTPKAMPPVIDECDTSLDLPEDQAIFLPDNNIFVTRVMSPCLSASGQRGHKRNAGWMAMGFPCTGGEGRIDWKGTNHSRPKMVSFLMETSCLMAPSDHNKLKTEASKVARISETAPLIAFNPFMIQYWEVPGFGDADTSLTVDLRSAESLGDGWTHFIKGKPLKVFLVGRENAWVPGNKVYGIEGEINFASKNRFTFKVTNAQLLSSAERQKIKARCESLKPERSCAEVF